MEAIQRIVFLPVAFNTIAQETGVATKTVRKIRNQFCSARTLTPFSKGGDFSSKLSAGDLELIETLKTTRGDAREYSDVSRDVTPRPRGVVYFCGWQKRDVALCFLLISLPKKRVRGKNADELLRSKLYKSVHKCIGNTFF